MDATRRFGPIAPPTTHPVRVEPEAHFRVRATVDAATGSRLAREAIQEGMLRPVDSHRADIETASLVWIPLWRMDAMVEGFHLGIRTLSDAQGRFRAVLPTGGPRAQDGVTVLLARRMLPWDPAPRVSLALSDMVPWEELPAPEGEVLDPDVTRAEAEQEAGARMRGAVTPGNALVARYDLRVRSAVLCHYPVWLRRYRYEGVATAKGQVAECHVAVSAHTGAVVSARHPSPWRSLAGRVRRLFP